MTSAGARLERKLAKKRKREQAEMAHLSPEERHRAEYRARLRKRLAAAKAAQLSLNL